MSDISFYHLTQWPLERALPKLLERSLEAEKRVQVIAGSDERVESLNNALWATEPEAWLPHGSAVDGNAEHQPIWLTTDSKNVNGAQFLFLTDGAVCDQLDDYERCFELFDGRDPAAVATARDHWTSYKAAGHSVTYWAQTERGGWEQKA